MKKITSLSLGISFIIMTYTGIMLFICPHGRVAYWSNWHLFGLSKDQYGELHTTSMIVFVLFGMLHIFYNWKPILSYLEDKRKKVTFTSKELFIALILNFVFIAGTLGMIQPFSGFLNFEESLKESWIEKVGEPPYGHAELSKLKIFCKRVGISFEEATKKLDEKGIKFNTEDTLLSIAQKNGINPDEVYSVIKQSDKPQISPDNIPSGLGRKTLKELSDMGKIDLSFALSILTSKGAVNIKKDTRVKDIANELNLMPIDIYNMIKKQ